MFFLNSISLNKIEVFIIMSVDEQNKKGIVFYDRDEVLPYKIKDY